MSGVVSVDRAVFGERSPAGPAAHVARLGHSPADTHLRQLCALCHLGAAKEAFGPNDEATRGGGCNACHLAYDAAALAALRRYERERKRGHAEAPTVHPAWKEFFAAYETALNDAIAKAKHQRSQVSRLEPTELESDPMHWLYPETKGRLKELYSVCPVIRGRRSYKEPLFLGEFSPPSVSAAVQR